MANNTMCYKCHYQQSNSSTDYGTSNEEAVPIDIDRIQRSSSPIQTVASRSTAPTVRDEGELDAGSEFRFRPSTQRLVQADVGPHMGTRGRRAQAQERNTSVPKGNSNPRANKKSKKGKATTKRTRRKLTSPEGSAEAPSRSLRTRSRGS